MDDIKKRELFKKSAHGVLALASRAFFLNIVSYIASLVIFTFLSPIEVGIYTAVIAIQRIISFITDFGFGAALIQKKEEITKNEIKTVFTVQAVVTLFIFIGILFLQSPIRSFFQFGEDASRLLVALVFTLFLSSFKVIPSVLLERKIRFHSLILPQIAESVIFNVLLILLVINGYGLESYTWAFVISAIAGIPFYYLVSPWPIAVGIDRSSLHHLKFGLQFQAKNILATIKDDFLTVFLAKVLSFKEIGYIGFGQRNAFFSYRYIVDSVTKVTFSTYARFQENKEYLRLALEKSLFYVSCAMFPLLTGLIIIAPSVILYIPKWHNKWEPALISLIFFSLNAIVSSLSNILVNALDANGQVKKTLYLMTLWTAGVWILTPLFIFMFGYNGVAIASFAITLTIPVTIYLTKQVVEFSFIKSIIKPLGASVVMGVTTYIMVQFYVKDLSSLFITVAISAIIYSAILFMLAKNDLRQIIKLITR